MTKPTIKIQNLESGEIIEREMNAEEFAQYNIDVATIQNQIDNEAQKLNRKAALLEKLGITADEAALLFK